MADPRGYPLKGGAVVDLPGVPPECNPRSWIMGPCRIIIGREWLDQNDPNLYWHLSMSCPDRLPTWDELMEARDRLLPPDTFFISMIPPRSYWLNVHPFCLHLWETRDVRLIEHMKANAGGSRNV